MKAKVNKKINSGDKRKSNISWRDIKLNKEVYLMLLPGLLFLIVVKYIPLYGLQVAFKDFNPFKGISGSDWVGFKYYIACFRSSQFWRVVRNTFILSFGKWIANIPGPILFAMLLNEIRLKPFKKTVQTISYFPHFISWVVVASFVYTLFGTDYGIINKVLETVGFQTKNFYQDPYVWRFILILADVWKNVGWGSILYLAAISSIPPEQYEAAEIDGCGKLKQALYITFPSLLPIASVLLILSSANLAWGGFEQVYSIIGDSELLRKENEILEVFTYRQGILLGNYSLGAAVGFFQNIIAAILIFTTNKVAGKMQQDKRFVLF